MAGGRSVEQLYMPVTWLGFAECLRFAVCPSGSLPSVVVLLCAGTRQRLRLLCARCLPSVSLVTHGKWAVCRVLDEIHMANTWAHGKLLLSSSVPQVFLSLFCENGKKNIIAPRVYSNSLQFAFYLNMSPLWERAFRTGWETPFVPAAQPKLRNRDYSL